MKFQKIVLVGNLCWFVLVCAKTFSQPHQHGKLVGKKPTNLIGLVGSEKSIRTFQHKKNHQHECANLCWWGFKNRSGHFSTNSDAKPTNSFVRIR